MATSESNHSSVKHLGDPSYSSHLSSALNHLRQQASLCDVTIIVGDQRFQAHKAVLSCASDYFQGMFSSGFQESTRSEVTVPGTEESFTQLLDFAYTGYFTLSPTTAAGTLRMACYMVFTQAMEVCATYLSDVKDKLSIEDCFEIWSIASNHDILSDLAKSFRKHLTHNFSKCVKSRIFLEYATAKFLQENLCDKEIETDMCTEEQILQGIVNWLKYDWEQRKIHTVNLLKKIHLGLIPVDRLKQILTLDIPECKEMVEEVDKLYATKESSSEPLNRSHPDLFATRNTITVTLTLDEDDAVFSYKSQSGCYELDNLVEFPYQSPDQHFRMHGCSSLVTHKNELYVGGGNVEGPYDEGLEERREGTPLHRRWVSENNFFHYDSEKNKWNVLSPMLKVQYLPCLLELDGYIYAFDSEYMIDDSSSVQRYSFSSQEWEEVVLLREIDMLILGAVAFNGYILCKGVPLNADQYQAKYMMYNSVTNEWSVVTCYNSIEGISEVNSWFVVHKKVCYFVNYWPKQVNRVICNLEGENPAITIAEQVDLKATFGIQLPNIGYDDIAQTAFTFDKRKLGASKVSCKCVHI